MITRVIPFVMTGKDSRLNVRISARQRGLLDAAAAAQGITVSRLIHNFIDGLEQKEDLESRLERLEKLIDGHPIPRTEEPQ